MYSEYADLNRKCFMSILAKIWNQWPTLERILKGGKHARILKERLSVKWMDQNKFDHTAAILSPPTPSKTKEDMPMAKTPEGVQK